MSGWRHKQGVRSGSWHSREALRRTSWYNQGIGAGVRHVRRDEGQQMKGPIGKEAEKAKEPKGKGKEV
eukprot:2986437-Amphidinium_carterae.1